MPRKYAKRRYRRKQKRNWTPGKGVMSTRQPDAFDVARSAWSGVKKIWRMINVENKHIENKLTITAPTTCNIVNLAQLQVGANGSNRTGNSIKPQNLTYRYNAYYNLTDLTKAWANVRVIFFRAKHENDVDITPADVLADIGSGYTVMSPKTYDKRFKTKIIYDKVHTLYPKNSGNGKPNVYVKGYLKLFGHVEYDTEETNGTDIENGGIYMLVCSDGLDANPPTVSAYIRLTYTDN